MCLRNPLRLVHSQVWEPVSNLCYLSLPIDRLWGQQRRGMEKVGPENIGEWLKYGKQVSSFSGQEGKEVGMAHHGADKETISAEVPEQMGELGFEPRPCPFTCSKVLPPHMVST